MDKFALPELQAFIDVLGGRVPRRKWFVNLSTGFYKTLCIVLVCYLVGYVVILSI